MSFIGPKIRYVNDREEFWGVADTVCDYCSTPDGELAEEEERKDLRLAEKLKSLLEKEVGPEDGDEPAQMQNWDWNDDRIRQAHIDLNYFSISLIYKVLGLLKGEHRNYSILLLLHPGLLEDFWGGIIVNRKAIYIQKNVVEKFGHPI